VFKSRRPDHERFSADCSPFTVCRYRSSIESIGQCSARSVFCLSAVPGFHWSNSSKFRKHLERETTANWEPRTVNSEPFSVAKPSDLGIFGVPGNIGP
jgi:hypothetical protein